jgi:ankyrin repeat protein
MKPGLIPFCLSILAILVMLIIGFVVYLIPVHGEAGLGVMVFLAGIAGIGACVITICSFIGVIRGILALTKGRRGKAIIVLLVCNSLLLLLCGSPVAYGLYRTQTDLHQAVYEGNIAKIKILLLLGCDVNMRDYQRWTPLHKAVVQGNYRIAEILLDNGANPNAADDRGETPLHKLCEWGQTTYGGMRWDGSEMAELLIARGADVNRHAVNFRGTTKCDWTPLQIASDCNSLKIMAVLLSHNADVNALDYNGLTALCIAARRGNIEAAKILIQNGAPLNSNPKKRYPLMSAVGEQKREMVKFLLEMGADPNMASEYGMVPLHRAASDDDANIVQMLLDYGANSNAMDRAQQMPLHYAALRNKWKNIEILLKYGNADIDSPCFKGQEQTALYRALLDCKPGEDQKKTAEILLRHGADPHKGGPRENTISRVQKWRVRNEKDRQHKNEILTLLGVDPMPQNTMRIIDANHGFRAIGVKKRSTQSNKSVTEFGAGAIKKKE